MVLTEDSWNSALIGRSTPRYTDVAATMHVSLTETSTNLINGKQSHPEPEMEFASTYEHHRRFSVPPVSKVGGRCRSLISVEKTELFDLSLNACGKRSLPTLTTCSSSDAIDTSSNSDDVINTDVFAINCPPSVEDLPAVSLRNNLRSGNGYRGPSNEFRRAAADVKSNRTKKAGPDLEQHYRLLPSISAHGYDKKLNNKPPVASVAADTPRLTGGVTQSSNTINRLHHLSTSGRPLQPTIANVKQEPNAAISASSAPKNPCTLCKPSTVRKPQADTAVNMRKWKSQQTLSLPRLPKTCTQQGTFGGRNNGNSRRPADGRKGGIPSSDAAEAAGRRSSTGSLSLRNNCSSPSTTQKVILWLTELEAEWPFKRPPSQLIIDEDCDRHPQQTDTAIHIVYSGD